MPSFTCTHSTTALQKFVLPSGRVIGFDYHGVLDADGEGARVIRAHPLYGRVILEEVQSAPAHGEPPALEMPPAAVQERERPGRRSAGSRMDPYGVAVECLVCGKLFIQESWSPRLYCGGWCRSAAYRARKGATPRWKPY